MAKKEKSDEMIVVDAERYRRVKKALEASRSDDPAAPPDLDRKEATRELVVVDVGRYKKVKKALEESEERYRDLFENVPIGIYRTTPDGRIIDANPALVAMLGYGSFAELAARNLEKDGFEPGYERGSFIRLLEREGEIRGLEAGWTKKDGTLIHVRENAKLIRNDDGQVFFEGTVEDITRSKLAEDAQRRHTRQIEILNTLITRGNLAESMIELLEKTLEIVLEPLDFDTAGIYMYDSEAKKVQLKARRGAPSQFYLLDEYMAINNMPFSQVLLRGQPVFADHLRDDLPDLAEKWGWRMACVIPLVSMGRIIGALGLASCRRESFTPEEKNILELIGKEAGTLISKLQTETALRESEKYYRTLVDTSPDFVFTLGLDGTMTMVNERFLRFSGFAAADIVGRNVLELVGEMNPDYLRQGMQSLVQSNEIFLYEYPVRRRDGTVFPMEMALSVLTDAGGQPSGIMGVGRDISERKRAELAIEEKNRILATLNEISLELASLPPAADIDEYIVKKLMSISRAVFVGITHYNKDTRQLEFAKANTASKVLHEANRILGRNVESIKYDISEAMYKEITSEVVGYRSTLHEASFGSISRRAGAIIQRLFNIDHFIGMALMVENELIGTALMAIGKGTPAVSGELLRSFSHIASVSLRRRQAECRLVASEEKFKKLFYISPDSIILSRLHDSRIVSVSTGFSKVMGYEESEVVGKTTMEINLYENPEESHKISAALRTKGAAENIECWFASKSGIRVLGLVSVSIIEINDEKFVMSTIRDITERKQSENALRESEETFRRTFAAIPSPAYMWVDQKNGCIALSQCNRAAEVITQGKIRDFLGIDVDILYADQPELANKIKATMRGGEFLSEEILYTYQSTGETKWLVVDYVRTSSGHVMVITRDVSERKEAEAKLLAYQEQLRALTSELTLVEGRERRRLAADLHDQIGQNLALCKLKVVALERGKFTERAKSELSAVRRLLECSIQDARSLIFDLSPPVLYELGFEAALEWLAEWIGEQYHIPVDFESHAVEASLEIDRQVILFQVVRELLVNMGKHSQAGRAKVILAFEGALLKIQVNDDGRGFDASRVFDPRKPKSGYGFFSMRERLKYLGGSIDVRSKPGMGSQIILTVPRESPASNNGGKEGS